MHSWFLRGLTAIAGLVLTMAFVAESAASAQPEPRCQRSPGSFELVTGYRLSGVRSSEPATVFGQRTVLSARTHSANQAPDPTPSPTPSPTPLPICTPSPTPTPTSPVEASQPLASTVPDRAGSEIAEATPTPTVTPDVGAVAPANVQRLGHFIEQTTGRTFSSGLPPITFLQRSQIGESSVEELVPLQLWDLLQTSGLVDVDADRELAAQAWGETGRGQCCPVIVVDGGDRTSNELIIVHELTHALDWPFLANPTAREVVAPERSIAEGNAHRIAYAYMATLDAAYPPAPALFADNNEPRIPEALQQIYEFPYHRGMVFTEAIVQREGEPAIIDAFKRPPLSVEVLHPDLWFATTDWPTVKTPTSLVDDPISKSGTVGAFFLQLMLEPHTGQTKAHELVRDWQGDAYAFTTSPDRRCIAIAFLTTTESTASQIAEHLQAVPDAKVNAVNNQVEFSRCIDPLPH